MQKLLFGTKQQAQDYATNNNLVVGNKPVAVNLTGFTGIESAPADFSGETNALVARGENSEIEAYLAYWE